MKMHTMQQTDAEGKNGAKDTRGRRPRDRSSRRSAPVPLFDAVRVSRRARSAHTVEWRYPKRAPCKKMFRLKRHFAYSRLCRWAEILRKQKCVKKCFVNRPQHIYCHCYWLLKKLFVYANVKTEVHKSIEDDIYWPITCEIFVTIEMFCL